MEAKDLVVLVANPWAEIYVKEIEKGFPEMKIIHSNLLHEMDEEINEDIRDVNVILSFAPLVKSQPKMKQLIWFQSLAAGVNHIIDSGVLSRDVILTNAAGVAGIGLSEFVMTIILAFMKKFPMLINNQRKKNWGFWSSTELYGKTLGILGLGHLGRPIAKSAKLGFNMRVIAFDALAERYEYADGIYRELKPVLEASDVVVITLPLTKETTGLLNEQTLKWMKKNAFLVNVARGDIIVREALIRALKEGWIAGAGLDVFWGHIVDVLPPDDEIWEMENVIISPHTAWLSEGYHLRAVELFIANLERFIKDELLMNVVEW